MLSIHLISDVIHHISNIMYDGLITPNISNDHFVIEVQYHKKTSDKYTVAGVNVMLIQL